MQSCRLVLLSPSVCELGGQYLQKLWSSAPWRSLKVLTPHAMALPAEHQCPGLQRWHWSALLSPRASPNVPASHGVGAELPALHHEKIVHVSHAVAPRAPWYVPAGHWRGS